MDTFRLEVTTPERMMVRENVTEAQIPARNGYIGVLPKHAPLLSELRPGEMSYRLGGHLHYLSVTTGYVEVLPAETKVLVEAAEIPSDINVTRAQSARERAEKRLRAPDPDTDLERARAALERALVRLQVASRR
jgi:F-type H+-transporting ATPase subunit epsilon